MGNTQLPDRAGCLQLSDPTEQPTFATGWSRDSRERGESVSIWPRIGSLLYFVNLLIRRR